MKITLSIPQITPLTFMQHMMAVIDSDPGTDVKCMRVADKNYPKGYKELRLKSIESEARIFVMEFYYE